MLEVYLQYCRRLHWCMSVFKCSGLEEWLKSATTAFWSGLGVRCSEVAKKRSLFFSLIRASSHLMQNLSLAWSKNSTHKHIITEAGMRREFEPLEIGVVRLQHADFFTRNWPQLIFYVKSPGWIVVLIEGVVPQTILSVQATRDCMMKSKKRATSSSSVSSAQQLLV